MEVTGTNSVASQANTTSAGAAAGPSLDYQAFLRLLMAEMKNQDPTNPIDSSQYVAQLASFSSVEQAIRTNSKLDALMSQMALSQADGIIGHTITSADGTVSGEVTALRVVSGGTVAVLEGGAEIAIGEGITIT